MMCEYVTVCPTGIFLRAKKRILFINFSTFPGNLSESRPHYFENQFYQRSLVYFYFAFIRYLYFRTSTVSGSITALKRYHGKGSS